jgi:hypothetical protein
VPAATTAVIWLVMLCKNLLFVMSNPQRLLRGLSYASQSVLTASGSNAVRCFLQRFAHARGNLSSRPMSVSDSVRLSAAFTLRANMAAADSVLKNSCTSGCAPNAAHVQEKYEKLASRTTCLVGVFCSERDDMPDGWQRTNHRTRRAAKSDSSTAP